MAHLSSVKTKSVCFVCLKRFEEGKGVSSGHFKSRLLKSFHSDNNLEVEKDESTKKGVYIRFMTFVSRYLKLGATTEIFLKNAGEKVGSEAFCESCLGVISYICDVYEELQVVKLHLIWKVEKLGEAMIMGSKKGGVSAKKTGDSLKALAGQLNLKEAKELETFRKILRLKCKATRKEAVPKVVVPRGLFPEEWKYGHAILKESMIRLLVVFTLASSDLHTKEQRLAICDNLEEGGVSNRKRNPRRSVKRKLSKSTAELADQFTEDGVKIKKEAEDDSMDKYYAGDNDNDDGGPGSPQDVCDTDWMNDVPSPAASVESSADSDCSFKSGNGKRRPRRRIRLKGSKKFRKEKVFPSTSTRNRKKKETRNQSEAVKKECPVCKKTFLRNQGLGSHMGQAHPNYNTNKNAIKRIDRWDCDQCSKTFKFKLLYNKHRKSRHPQTYSYGQDECPVCFKSLRDADQLVLHVQNLHTRQFPCDSCDKWFGSRKAVSKHLETVHHNLIPCSVCGVEYDFPPRSFVSHLETHETEEKNYFCGFCSCTFTNYQYFETHVKHRHFGQGNKIHCDHDNCSEDFQTLQELHRHLMGHLEKNTVPQEQINTEETQHANCSTEDNIFKCETCGWSFLNKHNLTLHKLLHIPLDDGAGYRCPECPSFQRTHLGLISHWNLVHENGQILYKCSICPAIFRNPIIFKMHLKIHHDRSSGRKFVCDICDVELFDSINLHAHRMSHDNVDKPDDTLELGGTAPSRIIYKGAPRLRKNPRSEAELARAKEAWSNLTCEACPTKTTKFSNPANLRAHLLTKHEDTIEEEKKTLPCYFCYRKFAFKQTHELHVLSSHIDRHKFVCDEETCTEAFQNEVQLNQHLLQHIEIDDQNPSEESPADPQPRRSISFCKFCNWGFLNPGMLELHELGHTEPQFRKVTAQNHPLFQCPKCDSQFISVTKLSGHYNSAHGLNLKPFKCLKCRARFEFKMNLSTHFNHKHPDSGEDTFDCKVCGLQLASKGGLAKHMTMHNPEKRILCPDCGKIISDSRSYKEHLARIHNRGEVFRCPHCVRLLFSKATLLSHIKMHEDGRLTCPECQKVFTTPIHLKGHMKTHNPNRIPTFVCAECGMAYKSDMGLAYHAASKHATQELLRYRCIYCPKSYDRYPLFKMHMKSCMKANGIAPDDKDALLALVRRPLRPGKKPGGSEQEVSTVDIAANRDAVVEQKINVSSDPELGSSVNNPSTSFTFD